MTSVIGAICHELMDSTTVARKRCTCSYRFDRSAIAAAVRSFSLSAAKLAASRTLGFCPRPRNHPPVHKSLSPQEPSLGPQRASRPDGPFCAGCPVAARCGARGRDPLRLPRAAQRSGGTHTPSLRPSGRVVGASSNDALPR